MRRASVLVVIVACYAPHPQPGSPCSDSLPCPSPLVCSPASQTCEDSSASSDGPVSSGDGHVYMDAPPILIDGCSPSPEICGDGIDQNCDGIDPPCPSNDLPSGAIDITAGGTFTGDLSAAHNDAFAGGGMFCGGFGGRDLFYQVTLAADEVYYFDTFGSNFDSVIRVYPGACQAGPPGSGVVCHNNQCASMQSQWVGALATGINCVVIDQDSSAETNGSLVLHVERGHRDGFGLSTGAGVTTAGDTTSSGNGETPSCAQAGNDVGYYFAACPGQIVSVHATTCNAATLWDTALAVRGASLLAASYLACNNNDPACVMNTGASTVNATASGAHLFWIIVDAGGAGAFGPFELDTTVQ